ncbi:MAG: MFS transporter [Bacteroidaceae bacterium]|nr:MFS transporter [Bacteroidaceae bacterium]
MKTETKNRPYAWVPSLYFAEALPYMAVMTLSVIMYTKLGLSNTDLALYTGWLYLPWVIKPLWSPIVDSLRTKRWWIISMQLLVGASLGAVALTLQVDWWFKGSLAFFWLMAFSSATHDIAADGFYILGLDEKQQALYVGIRSTAYRVGMIFCQGFLVMLAGWLEASQSVSVAWSITMGLMGAAMLLLGGWHGLFLPKVEHSEAAQGSASGLSSVLSSFRDTILAFGRKPHIVSALLFMLLFRFPEAQLAKMAQPFMLRPLEEGGLSLDTIDIGVIYGTVGVIALLAGGVLGGIVVSMHGLRRWWWPMVMAISIPDLVYIYFAVCQPTSVIPVYAGVALEQLGYGFGFTAYSLFLVYFSRGDRSTSVFSLCTALQALGMMLPGMIAGWLADELGFTGFFIWVAACCLVTFAVSAFAKIPEGEK